MDKETIKITKKGLEVLEHELNELVQKKRPKVVERLERARNEGDLSENSDYTNARDELEFLDGRIDELKYVIENAEVVEGSGNGSEVSVGAIVALTTEGGDEHEFEIVGEWEADPMKKKISHASPLGKALVGKKVGETAEVEAPAGRIIYEIKSIN